MSAPADGGLDYGRMMFTDPETGETDWSAFADHVADVNVSKAADTEVESAAPIPVVIEVYHALDDLTLETSTATKAKYIDRITEADINQIGSALRDLEEMGVVEKLNGTRPHIWDVKK